MSEVQYAVRRADGDLIFGEYGWMGVSDPEDWEPAQADSDGYDESEPVDYEMVKLTIERVAVKRFRNGKADPADE